ncbi:MAG TPA: phenylacetate--CoA ligase family protein [Casimicrobiaceae bacterium]|nr:phenylacetate--CoA ligase family protein [Casimicrobiaceae bacterium]
MASPGIPPPDLRAEPASADGSAPETTRRLAAGWPGIWQLWWERMAGIDAIREASRRRFGELVRHARAHSPLYCEAYRRLPRDVRIDQLPVMTRSALMARFDDWVTDPGIHRRDIDRFLEDRARVGERFLGRYVVWKSSGTSGESGIYVQDGLALDIYDALIAVQMSAAGVAAHCFAGIVKGASAALVAATGDHYASIASWTRAVRAAPGLAARGFSIMEPLDRLVAGLNAFAPVYLASYPTMLTVLADERRAGRLRIDPNVVWSGGEYLAPGAHADLERAFGCPVVNEYGASECMSIAFGCPAGWLHVNADWVIVEPVEADHSPTPPGEPSHTTLVTNLANRVQPVIRYDLGDAVTANPERCSCGNPLPAIRVVGRRDDVLSLETRGGAAVRLIPLALTTVVEEAAGVHRFQIVQRRSDALSLRLDVGDPGRRSQVFEVAAAGLRRYLDGQGLPDIAVELDVSTPVVDANSGKLRQVVRERHRSPETFIGPASRGRGPARMRQR